MRNGIRTEMLLKLLFMADPQIELPDITRARWIQISVPMISLETGILETPMWAMKSEKVD
jgi:hypothetical protein